MHRRRLKKWERRATFSQLSVTRNYLARKIANFLIPHKH